MAETYLALAILLEDKMDEHTEAQSLYRQGLNLMAEPVIVESGASSIASGITQQNTALVPVLKIIQ